MILKLGRDPGLFFLKWRLSGLLGLQISFGVVIISSLAIAGLRYQQTVFSTRAIKSSDALQEDPSSGIFKKETKPLSSYMDLLTGRDIFSFKKGQMSIVPDLNAALSPAISNFSARYIVQGIIHDKNVQAIIKDSQSNKTLFIHRNEVLDGATLVDIIDNRVIFKFGDETVELIKK